jgi:hypothetical protein
MPPVETQVIAQARIEGTAVRLDGTTDLPDGAVIAYSVYPADSQEDIYVDGVTTVRDGTFAFSQDASSLAGKGDLKVWLTFGVGWEVDQPLNVVLTYGPEGQRMAGDQVWSDSGDYLLETEVPVEPAASPSR